MFRKARTQQINSWAASTLCKSAFPLLDTDIDWYLDWQTGSKVQFFFVCRWVCVYVQGTDILTYSQRQDISCYYDVEGKQKSANYLDEKLSRSLWGTESNRKLSPTDVFV